MKNTIELTQNKAIEMYLSYVNDFLTVDRFAEYYSLSPLLAENLINKGKFLHSELRDANIALSKALSTGNFEVEASAKHDIRCLDLEIVIKETSLTDKQRKTALNWYTVKNYDLQTIADHFMITTNQLSKELSNI